MLSKFRPNLFIIGAMKSGTSSLHAYLGEHPSVFMSTPKEPEHFGHWIIPYRGQDKRLKNEREYLRLFETAGNAKVIGESSTSYTKLPNYVGAPQSIAAFNPDARLIYIMRDPIERIISHYWHMVNHGVEKTGVLEAVRRTGQDAPQYMSLSHYAMQLEAYFECFERAQIRTLTLEELKSDPVRVVQELFVWLGVDPTFVPPNIHRKMHVTPPRSRPRRRSRWIQRFSASTTWKRLRPLAPKPVRWLGSKASEGIPTLRRPVDRASVSVHEVQESLRPILQAQTRQLSRLLGREFPEWTTLFGGKS